ncbi:unnamed protein product [Rhizophagus irregularis]|nr:unnamed protein product [Rhizophagus irregularis]
MDNFISENKLKWFPYDKFRNVEYLDKGGFGTIYKAIWFYDYEDNEVILKCYNNLSENLNEFLNEWKYHGSCLSSHDIIYFYGFTKNPDTLKYMAVMDYANNDLMKKCWNEDSSERPSSKEVLDIIRKLVFRPDEVKVKDINEELKCNIMEFINAPIGHNNNLTTKSHPQAYYISRLLDFTSKELNDILESEDSQIYHVSYFPTVITEDLEDLDDCIIKDMRY